MLDKFSIIIDPENIDPITLKHFMEGKLDQYVVPREEIILCREIEIHKDGTVLYHWNVNWALAEGQSHPSYVYDGCEQRLTITQELLTLWDAG